MTAQIPPTYRARSAKAYKVDAGMMLARTGRWERALTWARSVSAWAAKGRAARGRWAWPGELADEGEDEDGESDAEDGDKAMSVRALVRLCEELTLSRLCVDAVQEGARGRLDAVVTAAVHGTATRTASWARPRRRPL